MRCRIYEPHDLVEAELLKAVLASEGIECFLCGEYLLGAVGCLPCQGLIGLWVEDCECARAQALIAAYNAALTTCEVPECLIDPGTLEC